MGNNGGKVVLSDWLVKMHDFTSVPNSILSHPDISNRAFRLWVALHSFHFRINGRIFPGMEKLAETIHMSKSTVFRAIKELEELGLVSIKHRGFDETNEYTLYVPQDLKQPGNPIESSGKKQSPGNDRSNVTDSSRSNVAEEENRVIKKTKKEKEIGTKEKKEKRGIAAVPPLKTKDSTTKTTQRPQLRNGPSTIPPKNRSYFSSGYITNTDPIRASVSGRYDNLFRRTAEKNGLVVTEKKQNKALLVSAFPGCGKTWLYTNSGKTVLDSDSSTFDKSDFPQNYIEHIKQNLDKADIILISTHSDVREELVREHLPFTLVYPCRECKNEYIERYKKRGSDQGFVALLDKMWDTWIDELEAQKGCEHIVLWHNAFLSDAINNLIEDT